MLVAKILLIASIILYLVALFTLFNVVTSVRNELVPFINAVSSAIRIDIEKIDMVSLTNNTVSVDALIRVELPNPEGNRLPGPLVKLMAQDMVLGEFNPASMYGNYSLPIHFTKDLSDLGANMSIVICEKLSVGSIRIVSPLNRTLEEFTIGIMALASIEALNVSVHIINDSILEIVLSLESDTLELDTLAIVKALDSNGDIIALNTSWINLLNTGDTQKLFLRLDHMDYQRISRIDIVSAKNPNIVIRRILLEA